MQAYGVVRRRREIGVRVALGARPVDVVTLVAAWAPAQRAVRLDPVAVLRQD